MKNELLKKSLERWKRCYPNGYLTGGYMISGDAFVELAKKYCDFSEKKSILELGPGYGRILASLISKEIPYNHFTGIDISINNINMLREHFTFENTDFVNDTLSNITLPEKYDIVLSSFVLKHQYPTFFESLANISNYVRERGIFFFDLAENSSSTGKTDLNTLLRFGPEVTEWSESKSQKVLSPWKKGNDTYIGKYTRNEISLILENIPLSLVSYDKVIHGPEYGERLVVIAQKK